MSPAEVLRRLRLFLLVLSAALFVGTLIELWLVNHKQDAVQSLAFVFCGLGLLSTVGVLIRRSTATIRILRACMLLVVLGSLFGIYEHVTNNIEFEREIHPNSSTRQLLMKGLGGANPLLAPGTLAVAGLLAVAASYKHEVGAERDD
jgi:fatty acid desaturase